MKKKIAIIVLLIVFLITFKSCRNEEILEKNENNTEQLKLIKSKSLWKENEKFINSIYNHFEKSVVPNEMSKNNFLSKYGNINWDYAMTFGEQSNNYLVAPVFKFGKITGAVKAQVKNSTVVYSYTEDKKILQMFFDVIYIPRHKIKPNSDKVKGSTAISRYDYVCVERSMSVWLNEGSGETPKWGTRYYQSCSWDWTDDIVPTDPLMYNCEECGQSGGGSGGSDDSNENTDPCATAKIGVNNANTTLSDARIKTDFTDKMKNIAASSTNSETGMTIGKDSNGNIKVTEPIAVTGTAGQVPAAPAGYNAIADGHNHNYSNPPSPGDLWTMMENLVNNPYFETRYIFGQDGSIYALTVNDRQAAIDFLAAYPRSQYLKPNSGDFIQSGALFDDFDNAKERLMNYTPFMSQIDATKNAMAYIMDKYGMGISLSKSNGTKLEAVNAQQNPDGTYSTSTCN